jgi:hypothetical protein
MVGKLSDGILCAPCIPKVGFPMNILSALASGPKAYRGNGVNHEQEPFVGELQVQVLEGGRAVLLMYSATLEKGAVVHTESTLLATGQDGMLCLWPVMSEIPFVLPHTEVAVKAEPGKHFTAIFGSGPCGETTAFREQITIQINSDESLIYAHAWGLPGGEFKDRSWSKMVPRKLGLES